MDKYLFTSESVTEGHPDKMADQISDAILDAIYRKDLKGRVACETLLTTGLVIVAGEITTNCYVDVPKVIRETIREIGYTKPEYGFDCENCGILTSIQEQSSDIALGVDTGGAGDQGMMFGYATKETKELMPLPITLAHKLVRQLAKLRKENIVDYLRPDGKSQVTVEYLDSKPAKIKAVVLSAHHSPNVSIEKLRKDLRELVVDKIIPEDLMDKNIRIYINPTGRFVVGGPQADTGVTGRKVIVDTYGGIGSHGGGCFCISGNSYVNTENGLQQIKDMKDDVRKGLIAKTDIHPHKIGDWYDNGLKETIEITTDNGYTIKGTPNHRIRVMDKEGQYVWRRLDSLKREDYIAIHKKERLFSNGVILDDFSYTYKEGTAEGKKNKFVYPDVLTEDYAYLLGLLVGDGNCMMEGAIAICVCEKEQKENVQNLYQKLFGRKGKIFGHWAYMGGLELRAYLQYMGLERKRSWEKQVPWCIFQASKECIGVFLRGLFDTDGGVRIHGRNNNFPDIKFTSSSLLLIKEVQQLLLNFGIVSRINCVDKTGVSFVIGKEKRNAVTRRPQYSLRVKDVEGIKRFKKYIGFGLYRKQKILDKIRLDGKRTHFILPHQRKRIKKLWDKLSTKEHQKDISNIGRFTRSIASNKATKNLTYAKLREFLCIYKERLGYDKDFQYLEFLYNLNHFYDEVKKRKNYTSVPTYDLYVPESNTFIANGFVCHNSGKDPTKVDRSASYYARYIAKNIVAAEIADRCEVQLAYAIGIAEPVSILVNTFGTSKIPEEKMVDIIRENFDLTPAGIIKELNLLRPIYKKTACYGHFGREDSDFEWEKTNKVEKLKGDL